MALNKSQKKFINKNRNNLNISEIANHLKIETSDVRFYLQKTLPKQKFDDIIDKTHTKDLIDSNQNIVTNKSDNQESKITKFLNSIKTWQIFAFLVLIGILPYLNSLPNDFVSDDIPTIKNVPDYLINPWLRMTYGYIGIRVILNSIIYHLWELNPALYRLPNLIFHALTTGVVFLLFQKFISKKMAILGALFFALHPMQSEAITWISGAPYSQSAFFMLLSFYFYIKNRTSFSKLNYILCLLMFILGLSSDAKSVVILAAFILYDLLFDTIKTSIKQLAPHVVLGIMVNSLNYFDLQDRIKTLSSQYQIQSGLDNPFVQLPISLSGYFQLYLWPQALSLYQTEITIMGTGEYVVRIIVTLLFFAAIVISYFKDKKIFFWLVFFLIALAPYLTPFRISWYVAERYAYISTITIAFMFAYGISWLLRKFKNLELAIFGLVLVLFISYGIRVYDRNTDWYNEDSLWFATFETSPSGYQIHNNMGDVYTRRNDFKRAAIFFENATKLKPDYAAAYHNLGITQLRLNETDKALENFLKAIEINPSIWQSQLNLGAIYYQKGEPEKAVEYVEAAYNFNPNEITIKTSLGSIYLRLKRFADAEKIFKTILQVDPNNKTALEAISNIEKLNAGTN